jgi:hypothetical protein
MPTESVRSTGPLDGGGSIALRPSARRDHSRSCQGPLLIACTQSLQRRGERKEQRGRFAGEAPEVVALIKSGGAVVLGVDDQAEDRRADARAAASMIRALPRRSP